MYRVNDDLFVSHGASYPAPKTMVDDLAKIAEGVNLTWRKGYEQGVEYGRQTLEPAVREAIDKLRAITLSVLDTSISNAKLIKNIIDRLQSALKEG